MHAYDFINDPEHCCDTLFQGRWGNAKLYCCKLEGSTWVVKDFSSCPAPVRATWGRLMISREVKALQALQGIDGVPEKPFRISPTTLCYRYQEGETLRHIDREKIPVDFFPQLELAVRRIHERNYAHLDLRNRRNILMRSDGKPGILDFQTALNLNTLPSSVRAKIQQIDLSGIYKAWMKLSPESIDAERRDILSRINSKRGLWFLRGYPLQHHKKKRR
jgi:RIO-like serine/threonine protein kinase